MRARRRAGIPAAALSAGGAPMQRCDWARSPLEIAYHDEEWGVPLRDDRRLFEFLILEGAQAGLSWSTILAKRPAYRRAFDDFDAQRIARYDERKLAALAQDAGIVRNRLKIAAAVRNARAYLRVSEEFAGRGGFAAYLWGFVDGQPRVNRFERMDQVPASTRQAEALSRDLKRRDFTFVGPTICYAFMQAVGMVNDHLVRCPRHREVQNLAG